MHHEAGRTSFNLIQTALEHGDALLTYFVFDLLHLDGEDLTGLPLLDRKARLEKLLAGVSGRSGTATTRSITARPSINSPASTGWKASSRSASMALRARSTLLAQDKVSR